MKQNSIILLELTKQYLKRSCSVFGFQREPRDIHFLEVPKMGFSSWIIKFNKKNNFVQLFQKCIKLFSYKKCFYKIIVDNDSIKFPIKKLLTQITLQANHYYIYYCISNLSLCWWFPKRILAVACCTSPKIWSTQWGPNSLFIRCVQAVYHYDLKHLGILTCMANLGKYVTRK